MFVETLTPTPRSARRGRDTTLVRSRARSRVGDGASGLLVEFVTDVADGSDQRLVFGAELGTQPPYVYVDGAGAAEVVVPPDLLQQLGSAEDPAWVLGEVLEQLELLVGQIQRSAAQLRRRSAAALSPTP